MRRLYAKFAQFLIGLSGVTGMPLSPRGMFFPALQSAEESFHYSMLGTVTFS
jgi:hypothetical protein